MYQDATVLVMLTISEPNKADQNPATSKLPIIDATSANMPAFSTKMNSPSVTTVNGSVNTKAIGRTMALTIASKSAADVAELAKIRETSRSPTYRH